MAVCRICGAECAPDDLLPVHRGGGCRTCKGSPPCTRCGHPRRHHKGTFGSGESSCSARVAPTAGLAIGRCGCEGYTTDPAAVAEAVEIVEVAELRLRGPDEPRPTRVAPVAPARDLFDETRRVGDRDEAGRIRWRPPR